LEDGLLIQFISKIFVSNQLLVLRLFIKLSQRTNVRNYYLGTLYKGQLVSWTLLTQNIFLLQALHLILGKCLKIQLNEVSIFQKLKILDYQLLILSLFQTQRLNFWSMLQNYVVMFMSKHDFKSKSVHLLA